MKKGFWKKSIGLCLCMVLLAGMFLPSVQAAQQPLLLSQAKTIALANSASYRQIRGKIALKEVSYKQAVKSLELKIRSKTTFRWSPLLSFHFPEPLSLKDSSDATFKPLQMQGEISKLKHDLTDEVFGVYEKVEQAYLKVYTLQEKVAFEERQLEGLKETLHKNKGRLILGLATQNDVKAMEKNVTAAEEKLAQDMKLLERAKTKLGDLLDMDVTTGYIFRNPYVDAEIPRKELDTFIRHTLDNDQSYYEAKMTTQIALWEMDINHGLLSGKFGGKMFLINPYVQQAKNGQKIDTEAFRKQYDKFLYEIDSPWYGSWRIIFFRFPKEWIKGDMDGTRYVEDEPYILYENVLEYQDALAEQKDLAKELEIQVRDSFETLVSARGAYLKLKTQVAETKDQLQKEQILNNMGELTFEEYTEAQDQYESMQIGMREALENYSSLAFSLDRLTCGAVSQYFDEAEAKLQIGQGGNSYIVDEETDDTARYYIRSIIEDNMFEFGIYLPGESDIEVTHFELWVDDYQVGERTEVEKGMRHLTLSLTGEERVFVRLYNDEKLVDDCEIDAQSYEGPLEIKGYEVKKSEEAKKRRIGSYEIKPRSEMGLVEIELKIDAVEDVKYYVIQNDQNTDLISKEPKAITDVFLYLDFLSKDMDFLQIKCYDAAKGEKYTAYFDTAKQSIYTIEE